MELVSTLLANPYVWLASVVIRIWIPLFLFAWIFEKIFKASLILAIARTLDYIILFPWRATARTQFIVYLFIFAMIVGTALAYLKYKLDGT